MGKDGHCHGSDFRGNYARPADWLLKIGYRRSKTWHPVLPLYRQSGHLSFPMPAYHTRATTSTAEKIMPVYSFQEGMSQAINLPDNTEASRTKLTINEIKGIVPLSNDTDMTAAYWKRLFVDLSLTLMRDMNGGDDKTRYVAACNAIASAKNIVIQLKKDIDTIDKWINE